MRVDYSIEEMLLQSANMVVYRARGRNGFRYALTRLLLSQAVLKNLTDVVFKAALGELKSLKHSALRGVIDGGIDKIDGMPWIAQVSWDGDVLEDRINKGNFFKADADRLLKNGQSLIASLGQRSGAISFRARDIVVTTGKDGQPLETFNIDLQRWFLDWAMGLPPGFGRNPEIELDRLGEAGLSREAEPQFYPHHEPMIRRPVITQELKPASPDQPVPLHERKLLFQEPRWGRLKLH